MPLAKLKLCQADAAEGPYGRVLGVSDRAAMAHSIFLVMEPNRSFIGLVVNSIPGILTHLDLHQLRLSSAQIIGPL